MNGARTACFWISFVLSWILIPFYSEYFRAICGFPRDELLDAAHILADHDERGRPEVPNGLCLCRLHHGGYDANLLGIRPDGVIEISRVLKETKDGPTLEHGFLGFDGKALRLPLDSEDMPKREYLEERYEAFRAVG